MAGAIEMDVPSRVVPSRFGSFCGRDVRLPRPRLASAARRLDRVKLIVFRLPILQSASTGPPDWQRGSIVRSSR